MPLLDRGLAGHLVGREVLKAATRVLASRGIPVMPLKGIWLQELVYSDPGSRPITDVDVLVPDERYGDARAALRADGWRMLGSNVSETSFQSSEWPLPLDLHRRLFTRGTFRMPSAGLFARGRPDSEIYGVEIVLPQPEDVFAHLVGHFLKRRGAEDSETVELRDLPAIAARFELEPASTARHLERCGLARASRYALRCVAADRDPSRFCSRTIAQLQPDPVGASCAAMMLQLRRRFDARSPLAAVPGFVLDRSLPRGLAALVLRLWERQYDRAG